MIIQSSSQIITLRPNKFYVLSTVIYRNIIYQFTKYRKNLSEKTIISALHFNYFLIGFIVKRHFNVESKIHESIINIEKRRILIICNHLTRVDPYLVLSVLPFSVYKKLLPIRFFTANMYFKSEVVSLLLKLQGCFHSHTVINKISGLKGGLKFSDSGHTLFMFPQGKRVRNLTESANVTIGPAYLAKYRNFTILPVHIDYSPDKKRVVINWGKAFTIEKDMIHEDLQLTSKLIMEEVFKLNNQYD